MVPLGLLGLALARAAAGSSTPLFFAVAVLGGVGAALSLLIHELGHVAAARRLEGVRPLRVSLLWVGAGTTFEGAYRSGRDQARVAVAGPAASLGVAVVLLGASLVPVVRPLQLGLFSLALLNGAIAVASLLPLSPLDGHKLLVGALWLAFGSERRACLSLRRLHKVWLPVEAVACAALLAQKPILGLLVLGGGAAFLVQRGLVSRP